MGRAAEHPEVVLQPYELLDVFPVIAGLVPRADAAHVRIYPGNNLGYFGPYDALLRRHTPQKHAGSCGAGRSVLCIEANGTIRVAPPCRPKSGLPAASGIRLRYPRDRSPDDLWGYCRTCYYAADCMSGCTWTSHSIFGRPGNDPYCHHRALEMQRAGLRERTELQRAAAGTPFDQALYQIITEPIPSL